MTIKQAAKILLKYPYATRDRPNTCYGGTSNVYECSCCRHALNVGARTHADNCELELAVKTIEETHED